jgi:hypothetical protein
VITEERIEQLAYEFVNDSDGTLGALQNALRNAAEESDRAARQECAEILGKTFEETGEIQYLKSERMVKATIKEPT